MAKQRRTSNSLIYWLIGAVIILILILVVSKSMGLIGKTKQIEVDIAKAKKTSIVEKVSASGTVQPVTEVKLAPEVSGEIRELHVEEGDSVKRGDLLVKIRPDTWLSQLERAEATLSQQRANLVSSEAALARAQATYDRAKLEFERQRKLWNNGVNPVISEAEWQLAQQNYSVAESDLKSARQSVEAARYVVKSSEASVNEARENVRLTSVTSPMDGVISKLSVKKGERVVGAQTMTGTELMRIADLNIMEVRVDVNENDIVRVHERDTAIIDVDAYSSQNKTFKGVVTLIANTANEKVSTDAVTEFEVRILILQSSYEDLVKKGHRFPFRPGMTASVEIITERKDNVLSVPLAAVTTRNPEEKKGAGNEAKPDEKAQQANNQQTGNQPKAEEKKEEDEVVFVNNNGTANMVKVKTGISDYDNIEIVSGLQEGQEVVTGPFLVVSKRLKEGDKIQASQKNEQK